MTETDGQVVVTTVAATLEDAIQQGEFHFAKRLTPADIESMSARPGVLLRNPSETMIDDSFFFEINDVVLYDKDGNFNTTYDQLKVNGSLELAPDFRFDWRIEDWELQELEFVFNAQETAELEFQVEVNLLSIELQYELARLHLGTIVVFVGPVPVVFLIEMPVYLRADGDVSVGITIRVTQQADLSAGLRYEDGNWDPIADLDNSFGFDPPQLSIGADFKGYIDPPLTLLLYGVAGPFAGATPYLKLQADIFANPWWELYGGIEATVGVKVDVLGHSLGEHTEVVIAYEILLAQAATNEPPNMPSNPTPPDEAVNQSVNVDLSWTGGDPDGDDVTYNVYLEASDITPDVLVCSDVGVAACDPGTLLVNTHYYWQVIATDTPGESTTGPIWDFITGSDGPHPARWYTCRQGSSRWAATRRTTAVIAASPSNCPCTRSTWMLTP